MMEADAVQYFSNILAKKGPESSDYNDIVSTLDALHSKYFVVQEGASLRVDIGPQWESFLKGNRAVFGSTATMQGFAAAKPHGYSGDFEIIERIYNRTVSQRPELYRWDEFFHTGQAPNSVRNRGDMFSEILREENASSVLSVGCGPGLDVSWALEGCRSVTHVSFLDNDPSAISRCKANTSHLSAYEVETEFYHKNALRFRLSMTYDLIWSSGIFDYLNNKVAIFLLSRLRDISKPRGVVSFGNFGHNNHSRSYMELIGRWFLIHRSASDLTRIGIEAGYDARNVEVRTDNTGLNHFAIARK